MTFVSSLGISSVLVRSIASIVMGIATLDLFGWALHAKRIVDPLGNNTGMPIPAAIMLACSAIALWAANTYRRQVEVYASLVVFMVASITAYAYAFGTTEVMDTILHAPWMQQLSPHPARISPDAAICFLLISFAHLRRDLNVKYPRSTTTLCSALAIFISVFALFGTFQDHIIDPLHDPKAPIAFWSAVGLVLSAIGLLISENTNGRSPKRS